MVFEWSACMSLIMTVNLQLTHRYKCYNNATKCRNGEVGPHCDDTGTSCGKGLYRGESTKTVSCVGFYTEAHPLMCTQWLRCS